MLKKFKTESHEDWLALRHNYIGGSDSAAIVGLNNFSSPYSVWAEKTGRVPGFQGNLATEVGTYLEEFVAQKFAEVTGKKVRRCNLSMVNTDYPWAIANVDRLIVGEDAGLEIKTTSELNTRKFKGQDYPANYYVQSMHYMAVTGKAKWYLAVLIGNHDFRWYTIERDEDEIRALMAAEKDFWDCVQADIPPAVDGNKATSDTLGKLYSDQGGEIDLTPVCNHLREYESLKKESKALQTRMDAAANAIKAYMQTASKGTFLDYKVSWKNQDRSTFDKKALAKDHPEIDLSLYSKTTTSRVFRFN